MSSNDLKMPNESDLGAVVNALAFAAQHHREDDKVQVRKGTTVPYLSHLMIVAGFVWESGGDTNQAVAAVLHDTLEDTNVTREMLAAEFSEDVAELVEACSDGLDEQPRDETTWRDRKRRYLDMLPMKSDRAKLVTAADKAHNGSAIVADVQAHGVDVWKRFNATPAEVLWYYERVLRGVSVTLAGTPVISRLASTVDDLKQLVAQLEASRTPGTCPSCGSPGKPLLFGYPRPEAMDAAERGEIALGGCMPEPFTMRCTNCGHDW
jgi:hypothetical protein